MKITDVEAIVLKNPLPVLHVGGGVGQPLNMSSTVVRVTTDEGIEGIGESWLTHSSDEYLKIHIIDDLRPILLGRDPSDIHMLWNDMWAPLYRNAGFARGISALDMALWDIKGKVAGLPLYQLLGGKAQERLQAYAISPIPRDDLDDLTEDILRFHQDYGFSVAKLVVGRGLGIDKELVKHVAETVGDRVRLAMDANGRYTFHEALTLANWAEQYEPLFFEEPLPWYDLEGLVALTARTNLLTSGFQEESSPWRALEYVRRDALQGYNVAIDVAGGVTATMKINHVLESARKLLIPHAFGPPIQFAATLHTSIAHPRCGPVEYPVPDRDADLRSWYWAPYIRNREILAIDSEGYLRPPEGAGLGIELDEDVLEDLRVA